MCAMNIYAHSVETNMPTAEIKKSQTAENRLTFCYIYFFCSSYSRLRFLLIILFVMKKNTTATTAKYAVYIRLTVISELMFEFAKNSVIIAVMILLIIIAPIIIRAFIAPFPFGMKFVTHTQR